MIRLFAIGSLGGPCVPGAKQMTKGAWEPWGQEEQSAYWSRSQTIGCEEYRGFRLRTVRLPQGHPDESSQYGFAECWLEYAGRTQGRFTLARESPGTVVWGYLAQPDSEMFLPDVVLFERQSMAADADCADLVSHIKTLLDHDFRFPEELKTRRVPGLREKPGSGRKRSPDSEDGP